MQKRYFLGIIDWLLIIVVTLKWLDLGTPAGWDWWKIIVTYLLIVFWGTLLRGVVESAKQQVAEKE